MGLPALIPGVIGVIGSLFGGGKGKATERLPDIMRTQQGKDLVNYLMSMYRRPTAGNYLTNMGAYSLMNKFYPNAGYQMPTNRADAPITGVGSIGGTQKPIGYGNLKVETTPQ